MIKKSHILKLNIFIISIIMLGYFWLINSNNVVNWNAKSIAALIGIMSFILVVFPPNTLDKNEYKVLNIYFLFYIVAIILEIINTQLTFHYSNSILLAELLPYTYIFIAYPLVYIFSIDNGIYKFLNLIFFLTFVMIILKFCGWYLNNYLNISVLNNLFLEDGSWVRNGLQRLNMVPLSDILFVYSLSNFLTHKHIISSSLITIVIFLYSLFVTQARFLSIILVIVFLSMVLFRVKNGGLFSYLVRSLLIFSLAVFIIIGGLNLIINIFSVNGDNGSSTIARLDNINHFSNILFTSNKWILGLGFLSTNDPISFSYLFKNYSAVYYLSDIGIFGNFVVFGLLSLLIYGVLYLLFMRVIDKYKNYKDNLQLKLILIGIFTYIVCSTLTLNIFDMVRAYNLPFYLAIYSYIYGKYVINDK